jgi:hypothetical protein
MSFSGIETAQKDKYSFAPFSMRSAKPVQRYALPPLFVDYGLSPKMVNVPAPLPPPLAT